MASFLPTKIPWQLSDGSSLEVVLKHKHARRTFCFCSSTKKSAWKIAGLRYFPGGDLHTKDLRHKPIHYSRLIRQSYIYTLCQKSILCPSYEWKGGEFDFFSNCEIYFLTTLKSVLFYLQSKLLKTLIITEFFLDRKLTFSMVWWCYFLHFVEPQGSLARQDSKKSTNVNWRIVNWNCSSEYH